MKKIYLAIILTTFALNLFSQNDHKIVLDSTYNYIEWDTVTNDWKQSSKREYSYDVNGNQTEMIFSLWDTGTSDWKESGKEEYAYDANRNLRYCTHLRFIRLGVCPLTRLALEKKMQMR
jgi:hypothetical protein